MNTEFDDGSLSAPSTTRWHVFISWLLEQLGVLSVIRQYGVITIDTRLPTTLQEVIDSSDLSRRLYSFQMQLEGEMKATDALASSTTTSFRKLLARLSNIDELIAKHREEIAAVETQRNRDSEDREVLRREFRRCMADLATREEDILQRIIGEIKKLPPREVL